MEDEFVKDLAAVINKHSMENLSNTPDFILAQYLQSCLQAYGWAVRKRDDWGSVPASGGHIEDIDALLEDE